ncbi:hypothetical protein FA15DRAFT_591560, partial [Coprinopsis marcescibilis]
GRAWRIEELRLKSFQDLHTLWYVTLRERNLLETQQEEARRMGVRINLQAQIHMAGACRKSMARIKAVMNERRLAYEGAIQLVQEHKEQLKDRQLLQLQRDAIVQAQEKLSEFVTRGRLLKREKLRKLAKAREELRAEGVLPQVVEAEGAAQPEAVLADSVAGEQQVRKSSKTTPAASESSTPTSPNISNTPKVVKVEPEAPSRPQTAAEAAAAGLFGGSPAPRK